jgi:gamma-glutamyltranspeptidase/glutathione hydrolase
MYRLLVLLSLVFSYSLASTPSFAGNSGNTPPYADANDTGAVATVNPLATQAGMDALARGGNAIDAAVAAALTLGVVDGHNSGIGGGAFVLIHWEDGSIEAIDGREMAPIAAHKDMYVREGKAVPELSQTGALAVGVPGSLAAYDHLIRRGGKLTLSDALQPGASLAIKGFPIDTVYANRIKRVAEKVKLFPASTALLFNKEGGPLNEGDILVQPDLALTYFNIATEGIDYFYRGDFAKLVAAWMAENGGLVTADDFNNYQLKFRRPVETVYKNYRIIGFPPPSSGGVHVAQILNMLAYYDVAALPKSEYFHLLSESMKRAFADRAYWLGDPDFSAVPRGLIDNDYAKQLMSNYDPARAKPVSGHGSPPEQDTDLFGKHTTHIAAADTQGNWIAITTTLNTSFGSKVNVPGTGVFLNNQMDDFSIQSGVPNAFGLIGQEANSIAPGKRPLSSMSPTIVLKDARPILTLGAAGGPTIITQVVQAIVNHLDFKMPLEKALAAPRIHHQWSPDILFVEPTINKDILAALTKKGHQLKTRTHLGSTQAIGLNKKGGFISVTEPRIQKTNNYVQH